MPVSSLRSNWLRAMPGENHTCRLSPAGPCAWRTARYIATAAPDRTQIHPLVQKLLGSWT